MRDSKSIVKLCEENPELDAYIKQLESQIRNYESFSARVYAPNKSYKELEEQLKNFEQKKKEEIDLLWEETIVPLQNQVKDRHTQLESAYKRETRYQNNIKDLETLVKNQQTIINYAAGYISACEQFREKHPNDVVKWLFEGLK